MIYYNEVITALAVALTDAGYNVGVSNSKWESLYPPIEGLSTGYYANHRLGIYLYPSSGTDSIEDEYFYLQDDVWTEEYVQKVIQEVFTKWVEQYTDTDQDPREEIPGWPIQEKEWDDNDEEYQLARHGLRA